MNKYYCPTGSLEKPVPEQLFKLASIGICLAKTQGKLYESRQKKNAHVFLAREIETPEVHSEEEYRCTTHKFIGRVARIGYKHWRMCIAELYWVSTKDSEDGHRAVYTFEWTNNAVLVASKKMNTKREEHESVLPEGVDELLFEASFVHAMNEFETVSKADCDQLIVEMHAFSRLSNALQR